MQKAIAVMLDENDRITEMNNAKKLSVFQKTDQKWILREELILAKLFNGSLTEIRRGLEAVVKEIRDCKLIVGKSITGLVFQVFNRAGFIISETDVFDMAILDNLYSDILKEIDAFQAEQKADKIPTAPVETEIKGNYFFDFNLLKSSDLPYTSKSTIIPFLNSTSFNQLEIICDHVMPWFEDEMKKRKLNFTVTMIKEGKCRVVVIPD